MENLNSAVEEIFQNFRTDVPGIRIRKYLRLIRTAQSHIDSLDLEVGESIKLYDEDYVVVIARTKQFYQMHVDNTVLTFDKKNVYDEQMQVTKPAFVTPRIFQALLAA